MTSKLRALLWATIIAFGGLVASLAPTTGFAKATLQVVRGSGDFETLETSITVSKREALMMQWTTDQAGATGGTWRVRNVAALNTVVASGEAPAPAVGHFTRFTIAANAFLLASPPATPVKFSITIVPHNAAKQPLGSASSPWVLVSQVAEGPQKPVQFGSTAVFPSIAIHTYNENIGAVTATQLHFAGADVKLFLTNPAKKATDPVWLSIKDVNGLMRQNPPQVSIPSIPPNRIFGDVSVHLDAILPPTKSQLASTQFDEWNQEYQNRCGVDLRAVMDWRGPQAQAPINDHLETVLAEEEWTDYAKLGPSTPICDSKQCVKPCQIAKNIHKELDGHVIGYSFFVGQYPKFDAYGQARTSANGAAVDFTPKTKVTVAGVSKIVTAIAAVSILDQYNVSLDAKIGPYLPPDWSASDYVKGITFAQLLSHTSGIKDPGNALANDYATLKNFFSQSVSSSTATSCNPTDSKGNPIPVPPGQGITPANTSKCYSNYNFAIFRVLLPRIAFSPAGSGSTWANYPHLPQEYADEYVSAVQESVFAPLSNYPYTCSPPIYEDEARNYAFAYNYPGSQAGYDWGNLSLTCGATGWYLSVKDIAKVLLSINAKHGKILSAKPGKDQFEMMRKRGLGWDIDNDVELESNGGSSAGCDSNGNNCGSISTSIAIFGPVTGPRVIGVLFINSNISGGTSAGKGAGDVLHKAYMSALTPK